MNRASCFRLRKDRLGIFVFLAATLSALFLSASELPPGTIIDTSPDFATTYIGSPSIAILPDGTYVASHDWFGPGEKLHTGAILISEDKGKTWTKTAEFPYHWGNLFVHKGDLYLMGVLMHTYNVTPHFSHLAIRKSTDGGHTWTDPKDSKTGLLRTNGFYHTAPCPIAIHNGRIWRAIERIASREELLEQGRDPGRRFGSIMASASVDSDLLDAESWTLSEPLYFEGEHWKGSYCLEGNAVVSPEGKMLNIIRVDPPGSEKAVIYDCSDDGKRLISRGKDGQIDFPGGAIKFTIRYDEKTKRYWTISSPQNNPWAMRNRLVLMHSSDLVHWKIHAVLFQHHEWKHHAWQYIDWLFEDDNDIVFVSRTAWDGSHNFHDANYMTFHRIENFRDVRDDAPWIGEAEEVKVAVWPADTSQLKLVDTKTFEACGTFKQVAPFGNGKKAFANRDYVWENVPEDFEGWKILLIDGGGKDSVTVRAKELTTLFMLTSNGTTENWTPWGKEKTNYTDRGKGRVYLYYRVLQKGQVVAIPQHDWRGGTVIFKD